MIYGLGARTMNTNSTLKNYSVESIYWNPAGLAFMKKSQIFIDYAPPLAINPNAFFDFQTEINSQIDSEFKSKLSDNAIYELPEMTTEFPSGARIQSVGFAIPVEKFTFAFSYYNPFELKLDFLESGFRVFMKDNEESATEQQTAFRASGDINGFFNIFSESYSFGASYLILENFAAGFTLERYNAIAKTKVTFDFNGSLATGLGGDFGEAEMFNDPSHGYPNSLYSEIKGRFTGGSWGIRLGSSYRINENSEVALTANIPPTLNLDGDLNIIENTPVFFSDGEINSIKIDSQTVRTKQISYYSDGMDIDLPGSFNIGYSHVFRGLTLISNIGFHFGEFSIDYSNTESNSQDTIVVTRSYKNGIKPGMDLRLGIDFGGVKLGTGLIFAETISDGETKEQFIIPVFSLAIGFSVTEHLRMDANLISLSVPFSRLSLSYSF